MSSQVFPNLPGRGFGGIRRSIHSNIVQTAASGREVRLTLWSYPKYEWEVPFNYLKTDVAITHFQQLLGFFNQMHGNWDTFLVKDDYDNSVTAQAIGTGDGATTTFQLVRTFGGFTEPMYEIDSSIAAPVIKVGGVTKSTPGDYSINATGLITFVSAPAMSAAITADFAYYFRARFKENQAEFQEFITNVYEAKQITLISANA